MTSQQAFDLCLRSSVQDDVMMHSTYRCNCSVTTGVLDKEVPRRVYKVIIQQQDTDLRLCSSLQAGAVTSWGSADASSWLS